MKNIVFALSVCLSLICSSAHAQRVALVIGNAAYQSEKPLANPVNDARLIAKTLKDDLQFDQVEKLENAGIEQIDRAVERFIERAQRADAAVFYFSGHGMQDDGKRNYLIPVDAKLQSSSDLKRKAYSADDLVQRLGSASPRVSLVVLDACRDNPFASGSKSASKGLARISDSNLSEGMLIAYATRDGDVAKDDSPYARSLADNLKKRDQPILVTFDHVASSVKQATNGSQRPTRYGDLPATTYLLPFISGGKPVQSEAERQAIEDEAWATAKQANTVDALESYLEQYPSGRYAKLAQVKLKALRGSANPPAVMASTPESAANKPQPGSVFRDCNDGSCPEMVWIPAGRFSMGSPSDETDRMDNEGPQHEVSVGLFALGKTEITVGQYRAFVNASDYRTEAEKNTGGKNGCYAWDASDGKIDWRPGRYWGSPGFTQEDNHPVVCISHNDAQAYVDWLSRKTGKKYRLPSEAEWEYAARGGTRSARYWGDNPDQACRYANVADNTIGPNGRKWTNKHNCDDGYWFTAPVGHYVANGYGLYDMLGNAGEWTADCWNENYNSAPSNGSAWKSGDCSRRVLRGGSWDLKPAWVRSALRDWDETAYRVVNAGFRVARTN